MYLYELNFWFNCSLGISNNFYVSKRTILVACRPIGMISIRPDKGYSANILFGKKKLDT